MGECKGSCDISFFIQSAQYYSKTLFYPPLFIFFHWTKQPRIEVQKARWLSEEQFPLRRRPGPIGGPGANNYSLLQEELTWTLFSFTFLFINFSFLSCFWVFLSVPRTYVCLPSWPAILVKAISQEHFEAFFPDVAQMSSLTHRWND